MKVVEVQYLITAFFVNRLFLSWRIESVDAETVTFSNLQHENMKK